ncbi:MAG: HD domain-containing protein [Candidatus Heimdallarchaeaceae archaeon]
MLSIESYMQRFKKYLIQWYDTEDAYVKRNIRLKEEHTERVMQNIIELSNLLKLTEYESFLAEITALYHDIARFRQFYEYKTFDDRKSFDHAEEGTRIIQEQGFLEGIDTNDKYKILSAIRYHNKKHLPKFTDHTEELLAKLIRDADKLDIWFIVGKELAENDDPAITLGYTDNGKFNPQIIKLLREQKIVDYRLVQSTVDFKLTTLGWLYDINFKQTFYLIRKNNVLRPILHSLPDIPEINETKNYIENFIESIFSTIKK